jgi:hypothetical protein
MCSVAADLNPLVGLVQACDVTELDANGLALATSTVRRLERSLAGLTVRIAQRSDVLASAGAGPCAHETLFGNREVSSNQARTESKRSRAARSLPSIGDALNEGETSAEHLDLLANALSGLSDDEHQAFTANEAELNDAARNLPPEAFGRKAKALAQRASGDHGRKNAEGQRAAAEFKSWRGKDGMGHFKGRLDIERFDALTQAIDQEMAGIAASARHDNEPAKKNKHLAATALCNLVAGGDNGQGRAHISLIVDEDTVRKGPHQHSVRETTNGDPLDPDALGRLLCDSIIQKVLVDNRGLPLDVGRRHRTATDAQWVALKAIYTSCAMCDRPISWCQAHHIKPWHPVAAGEPGGPTDLDNLVPLCSHHHHLVHEGGWTIKLQPDRMLEACKPDGTPAYTTRPDRLTEQ